MTASPQCEKARCCLLVLCGIPGAGKSKIAAALLSTAKAVGDVDACVVEFDKQGPLEPTTAASLQEFDPEKWKAARTAALSSIQHALTPTHQNQTNTYTLVIVDDTMHYRSMRGECWRLARTATAAYLQLHINCSLETALRRNRARSEAYRIPDEVLQRTAAVFQPPEESPSPWDRKQTTLQYNSDDQQDNVVSNQNHSDAAIGGELWQAVWGMWGCAAPPVVDAETEKEEERKRVEAARQETAEDIMHSMDLATRKILTSALEQVRVDARRVVAAELNAKRRELLESFKNNSGGGVEIIFREVCDEAVARFR